MFEQLKQWDRELFIYLNGLGVERYDAFWIFVTQEENWIPLYIFMIVSFFFAFKRRIAFIHLAGFLTSFAVTFGLTRIIKATVARIRPNNVDTLKEVIRVLQEPTYFSFVSGHTSTSMALVTFVVLSFRKRWVWIYALYIWPILFAFSRVYVGVHYPSDLFMGGLLGVLVAYVIYRFMQNYLTRKQISE